MKKIAYIISLVFVAGAFTACNEDPEYYELKDNPDQMHIIAAAVARHSALARRRCLRSWRSCVGSD